jgi:integrase
MKRTAVDHKDQYIKWKEKTKNGILEISKLNSKIIKNYIYDMELGLNVANASRKGARSYNRLYNLQQRMVFMTKMIEKIYGVKDLAKVEERIIHEYFTGMRTGQIKRVDGGVYKDPANFVKIFKSFWHWWQKVNRKKGVEIYDITQDLDTSKEKPRWVYLTEDQIKNLINNSQYYYKVLMTFLFDTGIRSPSELINIKVSDFQDDFKELNIRDEISKTFGRRIKLMLCASTIKNYVKRESLGNDDYLFNRKPGTMNLYLKRLAKRVLGDEVSLAGQKYSQLTMYDFRHCACCYWLPRYKSESALKYRFGWKKSDKIHYYSELLGMKDTITEEDMLMDIGKTELEKQLTRSENDKSILKERVDMLERQMKVIAGLIKRGVVVVGES